jgi:YggT family protein
MVIVAAVLNWIIQLLIIIVFIDVILSYFVPPYNKIRMFLDNIVNPLLRPIRRFMPQTGTVDLSPMVLVIILILLSRLIQSVSARL